MVLNKYSARIPSSINNIIRLALIVNFLPRAFDVEAADLIFIPDALQQVGTNVNNADLTRFEQGGQMPGQYLVALYVNGEWKRSTTLSFVTTEGNDLEPLLTRDMLHELGVKTIGFPTLSALPGDKTFSNLSDFIPDAKTQLDFDQQRLDISIPQAALDIQARGSADPSQWDQGITAAMMNYNISGARTTMIQGDSQDQLYMNLQSGFNLGGWRLRNYSTGSKSNGQQQFSSISSTLQHDIQSLKGQMVIGETSTPGDIFDSVMFRGVQIFSDDTMLPDSLRGFAPVIRGIAHTNAMVTVKQNGYTVYQSYVAPGAFEIRDLYPTATSGDLEVTVTEADGRERKFIQPFSSVPMMLREGSIKYALSSGEYRATQSGVQKSRFGLGTMAYGFSNAMTLYGGLLGAENYHSGVLGSGYSLGGYGSLSADITIADSQLKGDLNSKRRGRSYRLQYAKNFASTDTTVTLASYRYSSAGFYTFQEVNESAIQSNNKRSRLQLNFTQSLSYLGNIYLAAYQQDFWGKQGYERTLSSGYNTSINGISYSLGYTYTQSATFRRNDQQLALSIQVPLNKWLPNSWASYSVNNYKSGATSHQVGLNGTALVDNNLSYSLQQSFNNQGAANSSMLSSTYQGGYGTISGGYNYSNDSRQLNFGLQGGVLAHENGITFSQPLGDTVVLVKAVGAKNVRIQNNTGVTTDWRGYAVVPYANSYQENRVAIDTQSLSADTDIAESVLNVVPTRGAIVRASFNARTGMRALLRLLYRDKPVPFGATLKQSDNNNVSIVGENGQVYLSGMQEKQLLEVSWNGTTCKASVVLPVHSKEMLIQKDISCN